MTTIINPLLVVQHSLRRKRRNPSLSFSGIKNPRKALQKAHLHLSYINSYIDSKKGSDSKLSSFIFVTDSQIKNGMPNFTLRTPGRKWQLEFCAIAEDGRFIDAEFLMHNRFTQHLSYNSCVEYCEHRYSLGGLSRDVPKINRDIKLMYVILTSPEYENAYIFTPDQIASLKFNYDSGSTYFGEAEDSVDRHYKAMSKVKNPCPGCHYEWNDRFCYRCGHPH